MNRGMSIILAMILLMGGCAQWQQMTPRERKVVIGASVASALVTGAVASHDHPNALEMAQWQEWNQQSLCSGKHCK